MDKNDTLSINSISFGKYKGDILNNMLKQFCFYKALKIKFTGKGYKIKKVSILTVFQRYNKDSKTKICKTLL